MVLPIFWGYRGRVSLAHFWGVFAIFWKEPVMFDVLQLYIVACPTKIVKKCAILTRTRSHSPQAVPRARTRTVSAECPLFIPSS